MYIKYTGTLDSACTITIGPNTLSRVHIIESATSGSQNIIIKQGSGAEVTIANGFVKAVYLGGAGSGAAVTEAFILNSNVNTAQIKVDTGTSLGDDGAAGGTKAIATGDGNITIISSSALDGSTSGKLTLLLRIRRLGF